MFSPSGVLDVSTWTASIWRCKCLMGYSRNWTRVATQCYFSKQFFFTTPRWLAEWCDLVALSFMILSVSTEQDNSWSVNGHGRYGQRVINPLELINPLEYRGSYSATSNNMTLVHWWSLMGVLLHSVQRGEDWAGPQPIQAPHHCTKCNSAPINGQCTNHCIAVRWSVALRF